jgi:phosphoribosylformylglycinamidine cyclo-ligase
LSDVIMAPTRIYVKSVLALMQHIEVKGLAHITGGGLLENLPRILPDSLTAELDRRAWPRPPLFDWLQTQGKVADQELLRVLNCGIGMAIVVSAADATRAQDSLRAAGEQVWQIGQIRSRRPTEAQTLIP